MRSKPSGIAVSCAICGADFIVLPHELKRGRRCCSNQCRINSRKTLIARTCRQCGKDFSVPVGQLSKRSAVFCSVRCRADHGLKTAPIRFWAKVTKSIDPDGCWVWTRGLSEAGYGQFTHNYKSIPAHRYAYILTYGEPPADKPFVCHRCNNPPCVRPDHLYADDHAGNMAYKMACGRHPLGSQVVTSILTEPQVAEIKARYTGRRGHIKALAAEYGVSSSTVELILKGKTWKHV